MDNIESESGANCYSVTSLLLAMFRKIIFLHEVSRWFQHRKQCMERRRDLDWNVIFFIDFCRSSEHSNFFVVVSSS